MFQNKGENVKKYIYASACLVLSLATSSAFALTMTKTLPAKIFYCSNVTSFNSSSCPTSSVGLVPSTLGTSSNVDTALEGANPGIIGAMASGYQGWAYVLGTLASGQVPNGLALQGASSFTLTGQDSGKTIGVYVSYIPCGYSGTATDAATLNNTGAAMPGTVLGTTAVTVQSSGSSCAAPGGTLYLGLDTTNAIDSTTGYVMPDTYSGDLNFVVKAVGT